MNNIILNIYYAQYIIQAIFFTKIYYTQHFVEMKLTIFIIFDMKVIDMSGE